MVVLSFIFLFLIIVLLIGESLKSGVRNKYKNMRYAVYGTTTNNSLRLVK